MPSVESNTIFECQRCGAKVDAEGAERELRSRGCPNCGHAIFRQLVIQPACDFCSANLDGPCWTFPCDDFDYGIPFAPKDGSVGDWAACEDCKNLIEAGETKAVIRKAVEFEMAKHPESKAEQFEIWGVIARIHKGFHEHRTGPAYEDNTTNHPKEGEQ